MQWYDEVNNAGTGNVKLIITCVGRSKSGRGKERGRHKSGEKKKRKKSEESQNDERL
jgi:hypothetical protein